MLGLIDFHDFISEHSSFDSGNFDNRAHGMNGIRTSEMFGFKSNGVWTLRSILINKSVFFISELVITGGSGSWLVAFFDEYFGTVNVLIA